MGLQGLKPGFNPGNGPPVATHPVRTQEREWALTYFYCVFRNVSQSLALVLVQLFSPPKIDAFKTPVLPRMRPVWSTKGHLVLPLRSPEFFSVSMSGHKFVFLLRKLSGCDSISSGLKEGVRESQWIGCYGKPYVRKRPAAQLGARI
jgi:hypothetical protein